MFAVATLETFEKNILKSLWKLYLWLPEQAVAFATHGVKRDTLH